MVMKNWNGLFQYFCDLLYALFVISYFPFSFTFVCFIISFRLYLNYFVGDIFTFIFCCAPCFFSFDGSFKMFEIEVAKILFKLTFVEVESNN